jgi:hypothetical protein
LNNRLSPYLSDLNRKEISLWQKSTGGAADAAATSRAGNIDGRYPDTVGYLCPPISADNYHTEPYRSTHTGFYACVGAFCHPRHFFAVGCRSPPFVLEGMTIPTEQKERTYEARKKCFSEISVKLAKRGVCKTSMPICRKGLYRSDNAPFARLFSCNLFARRP